MKFRITSLTILIAVICSAMIVASDDLHQAMNRMMQKMKDMKMTGNPDHDFAMMMAEHHQGSIDMSEILVRSGKDEKLKAMAQSILDKQSQEQQQLKNHSNDGSDSKHSAHSEHNSGASSFGAEMKNAMSEMEADIKGMKMTNNLDHDFATMMIPHHESAIEMSDAVLKHGKDQQIKTVAEKIKSDSQKEISELKNWLESHGK